VQAKDEERMAQVMGKVHRGWRGCVVGGWIGACPDCHGGEEGWLGHDVHGLAVEVWLIALRACGQGG